jgi:hypothetical protein
VQTDRIVDAVGRDFVLLKRDGSLTDGVEVVSAPAFLGLHRKRWRPLFDAIGEGSVEVEARASCGMHVHVERGVLTDEQIGQMAVFLTNEGTREFVERVAGREAGQYCKVFAKSRSEYLSVDRYEALNTTGSRTVEVRVFASTTEWPVFVGRLEFVRALVSWCRETRSDEELGSGCGFVEWVGRRTNVYGGLNEYLKGLGLVKGA